MVDLYHSEKRLKTLLDKIKKNEAISTHNYEIIQKFINRLQADGVGFKRILRYIQDVKKFAEFYQNKKFEDTTKEDVENLLTNILNSKSERGKPFAPQTINDFKKTLRRFYKWLRNSEETPPEVKWIKANKVDPKITTENVLEPEDIDKMMHACIDVRDKLLISLIFTSGVRISECAGIKLKHIDMKEDIIVVSGKTGTRPVPFQTAYLKEYLENFHPLPDDSEAYLWVNQNGKPIKSYSWYWNRLDRIAKICKINKPHSPHCLRHASCTYSCDKVPEPVQRLVYGWSKTSKTPATYQNLKPKKALNTYKKNIFGKGKDEPKEELGIRCKCNYLNPLGSVFCLKCGQKLKGNFLESSEKDKKLISEKRRLEAIGNLGDNLLENKEIQDIFEKVVERMVRNKEIDLRKLLGKN